MHYLQVSSHSYLMCFKGIYVVRALVPFVLPNPARGTPRLGLSLVSRSWHQTQTMLLDYGSETRLHPGGIAASPIWPLTQKCQSL